MFPLPNFKKVKKTASDFFSDISGFLNPQRVLGVDIGTSSIKLVEFYKKGEDLKLENYGWLETKGYLERGNEIIQASGLKISVKETVGLVKTLLAQVKPKAKNVIASIPAFSAFVTPFDLPFLSARETAAAISFQARQFIPLPLSEVSLDWLKIDEFENQKGIRFQRILLIGIPREVIKTYQLIFKTAGLKLAAVEVESLALLRAVMVHEPLILIADLGAVSTNFVIAQKGVLKYSGQSDYGGAFLTQVISRSLEISPLRAEELKCRSGLLATAGEYELSALMLPFLDVIIGEARRVKETYERSSGKKVERLMLAGGGANLPGIEKYFSKQMDLAAVKPFTFSGFKYPSEIEPMVKELNNILAVAVGLAKRKI